MTCGADSVLCTFQMNGSGGAAGAGCCYVVGGELLVNFVVVSNDASIVRVSDW